MTCRQKPPAALAEDGSQDAAQRKVQQKTLAQVVRHASALAVKRAPLTPLTMAASRPLRNSKQHCFMIPLMRVLRSFENRRMPPGDL